MEHQIADAKQRLTHIEQLSIENNTKYQNFEENLQEFDASTNRLRESLETRLEEATVDDIRALDVSVFPRKSLDDKQETSKHLCRFRNC